MNDGNEWPSERRGAWDRRTTNERGGQNAAREDPEFAARHDGRTMRGIRRNASPDVHYERRGEAREVSRVHQVVRGPPKVLYCDARVSEVKRKSAENNELYESRMEEYDACIHTATMGTHAQQSEMPLRQETKSDDKTTKQKTKSACYA